jgi:hypothetical protein
MTYIHFVDPLFSYFGLGLRFDIEITELIALIVIAWAPSLLLPTRLFKPSDFLVTIQYLLIYVPAVWVAMNSSLPVLERETAWTLIFVLFAAMLIQLASNRFIPVYRLEIRRLTRRAFWIALLGFSTLALVYLGIQFGGNFQIVSLDKIYEVRTGAAETVQGSGSNLIGYLFNWTAAFLLPLVLALAIVRKSFVLAVSVCMAYLFLFGVWGSKATLLAPIAIFFFAWLLRDQQSLLPIQLIITFSILLISPVFFIFADEDFSEFIVGWIVSLIHQRTFSSSALLIPQYIGFFETHPYTLGSHIGLVGRLIDYPFGEIGVPTMVGLYTYGGPMTANVNYWAQDGISAFGLWGILPIAVMAALVFWLLDFAARGLDPRFVTLCVVYAGMNLADTSLFTSLITGGLALSMFSLLIMPRGLAVKNNQPT